MKVTKQARRSARDLIVWCTQGGSLNEDRVREVVRRISAEKPRGFISILNHFQRLVKLEIDRRTAVVESPIALDAPAQNQIIQNLTRLYGQGLNVSFVPSSELLGGLRIKVGSDVYDGSVQARLKALQESF